jgi:hypothetical protein
MPPSPAHSTHGLMPGTAASPMPPPAQPDAMAAMQAQIAALQEQLLAANSQPAAPAANLQAGTAASAAAAAAPAAPDAAAALPTSVPAPEPSSSAAQTQQALNPRSPVRPFEKLLASAVLEPEPEPEPEPDPEPGPEPEPLAMPVAAAVSPARPAGANSLGESGREGDASLSPSQLGALKRMQSGMSTSPGGDDAGDTAVALKGENAREVARDLRRRAAAAALQRTSSGESPSGATVGGGNKLGGDGEKQA